MVSSENDFCLGRHVIAFSSEVGIGSREENASKHLRSPNGAKRNPGPVDQRSRLPRISLTLHPGYALLHVAVTV
jgi:hypothetical protein